VTTREVSYNLAGCVRNQSLGVAGTTVVLYDYWSTGSGLQRHYLTEEVTNARGEFSFDVRQGIYSLEIVPNRDTRFHRQSVETIKVTNNTTLTINLQNGCLLTGSVRTASGDLLSACELVFFGIEPEALRAKEAVDGKGEFSISLPRGRYEVACRHLAPKGKGKQQGGAFLCTTMGVLDVTRDLRDADIVLPVMVAFKGAVTNAEGHPVGDVKVTIRRSQPEESRHSAEAALIGACYTNKIGQFECLVEPGLYDVKLEPGPESHLSERLVSSILVDQARMRTYALGSGYQLAGTVTYDGEPVENALVSVHGAKTDSSVLSDEQGEYAFALSGGSYEVTVTAQPDSLARLPFRLLAPFTCTVKLAEDTLQDVALVEGVSISGKVLDSSGKPRPGVQLTVYKDTGEAVDTTSGAQRPLMFGISGDDGSYEFRVCSDKYWLVINNQQSTAQLLEPGESNLQGDLTWHNGCVVDFDIVSDRDEPLSNCQVTCQLYGSAANAPAEPLIGVSDDHGVCHLSLPAGVYSFKFEPPAHGSFQPKNIRQLSVSADVRRKVKLSPKVVTARLTD
jgi:uncharacterized GH25 family protein